MGTFIIKSVRGGISEFEEKGIAGSFKFGSGIDIRKKVDSISCQQAFKNLTPDLTDLVYFLVPAPDGNLYAFTTTKVYKITTAWATSQVYTHASNLLNIDGAGVGFESSGDKAFIYWVSGTTLHRKEIPGNTSWTDVDASGTYPKTGLQDVTSHPFKWVNGNLYFGNGRYLGLIGYDSSYTNSALDLGKDIIINTLLDRDDYVVMGTEYSTVLGKSQLFLWDTISLSWNRKKAIPIESILGLVDSEFPLLVGKNTLESDINSNLYSSDFISIVPIISFPTDASGGLITTPDAIDLDKGMGLFGMYDTDAYADDRSTNGIYTYGRNNKNASPVLNLDYPLDCNYIYSVRKWANGILVSYSQPTSGSPNYKTQVIDTANKATGVYESLVLYAPPSYAGKVVPWHYVRLSTKPMPANTSIGLKYKTDRASAWTSALLEGGDSSFNSENETEAVFYVEASGKTFEFQITLTPTVNTTPEVYMPIEVNFD